MLSLSRHLSEKVCITVPPSDQSTRIEVMVVSLNSNKAKLGFTAVREVIIHRAEIQERIDREMQESDTREAR